MTDPFARINLTPVEPEEPDFDYKFPDDEIAEKIQIRCRKCSEMCVKSPHDEWVHAYEIARPLTKITKEHLGMHEADPDITDVQEVFLE